MSASGQAGSFLRHLLCFLPALIFIPQSWGRSSLPNDASPVYRHFNSTRGFDPFDHEIRTDTSTVTKTLPLTPYSDFTFSLTAASPRGEWGITLTDRNGDRITLSFRCDDTDISGFATPALHATASKSSQPGDTVRQLTQAIVTEGVGLLGEPNSFSLIFNGEGDGEVTLLGGNHGHNRILGFPTDGFEPAYIGIHALKHTTLTLDDITLESRPAPWRADTATRPEVIDPDDIAVRLAATRDDTEGYWTILDRNFDEKLIRLGGRYLFAILRSEDSTGYDLHYIDGGETDASHWIPGELKARLTPSRIKGIYNVEWLDSRHLPMSRDIEAQKEGNATLRIAFPYQNSILRLQKLVSE